MPIQITAVHLAPDGAIDFVLCVDPNRPGIPMQHTTQQIADAIRRGGSYFYTVGSDQRRGEVEVYERNGRVYIRTKGDSSVPDNLLSLRRV